MSVSLRELTVADVAVLRNISIATFTETFADSNSAADMELYIRQRFSVNQLTQELANPESFFYTAEVQGQTVGYLKLNTGGAQTEPQQENALEIERIYVLGTHHGHGVGQALYQHALTVANQRAASYIWLGVWEHNHRALRFYQKNGFTAFGQHIFRLGDDEQTDILMKHDLNH